jgi:ankyrin repeat protein
MTSLPTPAVSPKNRIHFACIEGNLGRLHKVLGEKPPLINVPDAEGDSPLIIAITNDHLALVEYLLNFNITKVDVNFLDSVYAILDV